jgi:hypothetical protein
MKGMKALFKFEGMNYDYMDMQMEGVIEELKQPKENRHMDYINEKLDNLLRHFNSTVENFKSRIGNETNQDDFIEVVEREGKK